MERALYPEVLALGKFKTGLPGSRRFTKLLGMSVQTIAGSAELTLDPAIFQNDTGHYLFVAQLLLNASVNSSVLVEIKPTSGQPWTKEALPYWAFLDVEGGAGNNSTARWILKEPFPVPPGAAFDIRLFNRTASSLTALLGLSGYIETEPAYTRPRLSPYVIGQAGFSIAPNVEGRLEEAKLYPSVPFEAEKFSVRATTAADADIGLRVRFGVKGRPRVVEGPIPIGLYQETNTRGINLYGMKLGAQEGFQVDLQNVDAANTFTVDATIRGYRIL